MLYFKAVFQ